MFLTTKQRQGFFWQLGNAKAIILTLLVFLTFDFGARNQAVEAQGTRGGAHPQGTRARERPAQATECLGISKNPFRQA